MFLIKSPLLHLLGLVCFIGAVLRKGFNQSLDVFDEWLAVGVILPILILSFVGGGDYDASRQMLFWYPLVCLASARGWTKYWNVDRYRTSPVVFGVLMVYLLGHLVSLHPNEAVFFNDFVGKEKGASGHYELDYYGNVYRQGARWLRDREPEGTSVYVPRQGNLMRFYLDEPFKIREKKPADAEWAMILPRGGDNPFEDREPYKILPSQKYPFLYVYRLN